MFIPGKPNRWLAINAMGVRIGGDYPSESLAQSALNDQIVATPEPTKRARCSHCRSGYHTADDCPVKAAEGERIAAARKAKESHGKHEDPAPVPDPVRGGDVTPDYLSAVRRLDTGKGVTAFDVHSDLGLGTDAVSTRHRLDLLVDVGRLARTRTGHKAARYRVRIRPEIIRAMFTSEDADLPDVPAPNGSRVLVVEDPPTPPEILDPDVLRPEDPTECVNTGPCGECPCEMYCSKSECQPEDAPYVCPGCHAVGEAPCSPTSGCPEAEIGSESSASLLDEVLGPLEDDDSDPEFTDAEIREHLPDGGYAFDHDDDDDPDAHDPWYSWLPDVRQSSADVSTTPVSLTPIRAQQIIRREQRLHSTRDERAAKLREAVRVLRALADVGEGLIGEVGR